MKGPGVFELVAVSREHRKQRRQKVDNGDVIRVGRKPEDGFAVPWDTQISREHVELVIKSGKVVVKKLATAQNGVHFKGKALQKFKLKPGDQFRIGLTTFQFHEQSEADSMVGEDFGDFALSKPLGEGALGVLYGASKRSSRMQAALRVLEPCLVNTAALTEQFLNQGKLLCESQPGGIASYMVAEQNGPQWYTAREYVLGMSVEQLIKKNGAIPAQRALEIVQQIARQLTTLHELRLCHGNLKPSNVIYRIGMSRLVDLAFGMPVARRITEPKAPRSCQTFADYVAPEVIEAGDTTDIRSDLYSLGCVWFELATGQPVFPSGDATAKLISHKSVKPNWQRLVDAGLNKSSIGILQQLLAKSPRDRPETPAALLAELNSSEVAGSFVQCEGCDKRYRVRAEQSGKKLRCKECGSVIVVPHSL